MLSAAPKVFFIMISPLAKPCGGEIRTARHDDGASDDAHEVYSIGFYEVCE